LYQQFTLVNLGVRACRNGSSIDGRPIGGGFEWPESTDV
jgi:hypothetical protein